MGKRPLKDDVLKTKVLCDPLEGFRDLSRYSVMVATIPLLSDSRQTLWGRVSAMAGRAVRLMIVDRDVKNKGD